MKPILYVITPVSRPHLLGRVAESIRPLSAHFDLRWMPTFDDRGPDLGGNRKRNIALDQISESGWHVFLDDDTVVHPAFATALTQAIIQHPRARMFVFHQCERDGFPRHPMNQNIVRVGNTDTGQYVMHSDAIGRIRWRENDPFGDSIFAEEVIRAGTSPVFIPIIASVYNALR